MQFKCQKVLFWPIDRTLSSATTLGQSGPGSDGNEGVLSISHSSSITGDSSSDCLSNIQDTRWMSHTSLQRCSWYIRQFQPTGPHKVRNTWRSQGYEMIKTKIRLICGPIQFRILTVLLLDQQQQQYIYIYIYIYIFELFFFLLSSYIYIYIYI